MSDKCSAGTPAQKKNIYVLFFCADLCDFSSGSDAGNDTIPGDLPHRPDHAGYGSARFSGGEKESLTPAIRVCVCVPVTTGKHVSATLNPPADLTVFACVAAAPSRSVSFHNCVWNFCRRVFQALRSIAVCLSGCWYVMPGP